MNDLKKNINLPLMYEIRKDVFANSGNTEYGERLFSMMYHMDLLARIARKEGLLALEDVLLYFMMILSIMRIQDGAPPNLLESLLVAYLSDDAAEKYTEYKKQYQSARQEQTPLEILLSHGPDIGEGVILVVKRLLEEKIELADVQTLKGVITEAEDTDLVISLKGLPVHARKKLFSVISDYKADEYASHCEYMGPVRQIDVMASMSKLIVVFEKQERLL